MPGKPSRNKGARGEREFIQELREWLGDLVPDRRLDAPRDGGHDLIIRPYCIEIKRCEELKLATWWNQARVNAAEYELKPALAYRKSRQPWIIVVPMWAWWEGEPEGLQYTARVTIAGFASLILEQQ